MRGILAALAFVACAGSALASGYDDFAAGLTANVRDNPSAAVASFTAALNSGDLDAPQTGAAYRGRARAELELRQCEVAAADLKQYAATHTLERETLLLRARIRICLGDATGAKEDWQTFAGASPSVFDHWAFARLLWSAGLYSAAHDAMLQAVDQMGPYQYEGIKIVLWYAMAAERAGKPDHAKLADLVKTLNTRDWPMIAVNLYLGTATTEKVVDHADSLFSETKNRKLCEADFYIAEWHLARGDSASAKPLLTDAIARCPKSFIEFGAAEDEMKRLDTPPSAGVQ